MDTSIAAAAVLGLVGSFHCVGMCAPIALALPQVGESKSSQLLAASLYNLGRASTYATLGAVVGAVGLGFMLANVQQIFSISIGAILLLSVLLPWLAPSVFKISQSTSLLGRLLSPALGKVMRRPSQLNMFLLGSLNGLLPCGLVYTALAGATLTLQPLLGAGYMFAFGLGTAPLMLAVTYSRGLVSMTWRRRLQASIPFVVAAMGALFILRGLNLGIPYLSPMLQNTNNPLDIAALPVCH